MTEQEHNELATRSEVLSEPANAEGESKGWQRKANSWQRITTRWSPIRRLRSR